MHFEILVEDQSGKKALDILVPKLIGTADTFRVHPYKGVGRVPTSMRDPSEASKRILMDNLPKLLQGHGRNQAGRRGFPETVILVCDLDEKCLKQFLFELNGILNRCDPKPETRFCIAIEEGEAWFLGDIEAVKAAYPRAKDEVLRSYRNDSICGTWERLADAVCPGGALSLSARGWQAIGAEKTKWAEQIAPYMNVQKNNSPSFRYFVDKIQEQSQID